MGFSPNDAFFRTSLHGLHCNGAGGVCNRTVPVMQWPVPVMTLFGGTDAIVLNCGGDSDDSVCKGVVLMMTLFTGEHTMVSDPALNILFGLISIATVAVKAAGEVIMKALVMAESGVSARHWSVACAIVCP